MKKNNINIYIFTGTGNTLLVANKISETFNNNTYNSVIKRMEAVDPKNVDLSSTIGIGFTVAFWNTYPFVREWVNSLPNGNETEIFLFSTMGDSAFWMIAHIAKILETKNYKVIGSKSFVMPNNFLLVKNHISNMEKINAALEKAGEYAKQIISGKGYMTETNFISSVAFAVSSFVVTRLLKTKFAQNIMKFKINKFKCTRCSLCKKICPVNNITLDDLPQFNNKCQFCLRCVSYCPQKALSNIILLKTYRALSLEEIKWR